MRVFRIFVFAPVQRNWACFTWKGAPEIRSLSLLLLICNFCFSVAARASALADRWWGVNRPTSNYSSLCWRWLPLSLTTPMRQRRWARFTYLPTYHSRSCWGCHSHGSMYGTHPYRYRPSGHYSLLPPHDAQSNWTWHLANHQHPCVKTRWWQHASGGQCPRVGLFPNMCWCDCSCIGWSSSGEKHFGHA